MGSRDETRRTSSPHTPDPRRHRDETLRVDRETLEPLRGGARSAVPGSSGSPGSAAAPLDWQVGPYVVERELGRGGMGIVHLAFDTELLRHVALKVLPRGLAAGAASRARFLREARAMARVRDARVVGILQVLESEDGLALALDYIEGCTLANVVDGLSAAPDAGAGEPALDAVARWVGCEVVDLLAGGRYARWVAHLGEEIGGALQSVHEAGVLHRDVKPSNVLLDRRGNPRVSDFGVALDPGEVTEADEDVICGTAQYASPEQLRGRTDLDARTDVYGLGALLYELLALRPPTTGSPKESLESIESRRVLRLGEQIATWVPRDLAAVIHKAMDPDRDRRYATPADLAADLRSFRFGDLVGALPQSTPTRLWRWLRREPARLAVAALLLAAVGIGAWLSAELPRVWADRRAERQAQVSESIAAGFLYLRDGALKSRALEPFEAALRVDPDSALALAGLVLVRSTLGDAEGACRELDARHELVARHAALRALQRVDGEVYRRSPAEDRQVAQTSDDPLELFVAAVSILRRSTVQDSPEEYGQAISILRSALELSTGRASEHLHGELVSALAARGDQEELRRAVATFRARYGDSWVTHFRIAMALDAFDPDGAQEAVQAAAALGANPIAVALENMRVQRARGGETGRAEAMRGLSQALERHPDAPELALALALLLSEEQADRKQVEALLARSREGFAARLAACDDDALAVQSAIELAQVQQMLGEVEAARATLEAARTRSPGSWLLDEHLGMLDAPLLRREHPSLRDAVMADHARLGAAARDSHAEAIESFRRRLAEVRALFGAAFDAAPYHKLTARNLAVAMVWQTGEFGAALPVVQRVHELEPWSPDHLLMLGVVLNQLDRPAEALTALQRAEALSGDKNAAQSRGRLLLESAWALMQTGRFQEARQKLVTCESERLLRSRRERSNLLASLGLLYAIDPEQRDVRQAARWTASAQRLNAREHHLPPRIAAEQEIALGQLDLAARYLADAEKIAQRFIDCEPIEAQRELARAELVRIRARRAEVQAALQDGATTLVAVVPR